MHPSATASLGEEFQRLKGPAAAGGGGRSDQQDEWRRWGGERRWMSSGWVVWQVGGAQMTDGDGGENRCRKEKKVNRNTSLETNRCLVTAVSTKEGGATD